LIYQYIETVKFLDMNDQIVISGLDPNILEKL